MERWIDEPLTTRKAHKLARDNGIHTPRVGYEVSLGNGLWLQSTGHSDFGWFASNATTPYRLFGKVKE
jgi:hypothetical protein